MSPITPVQVSIIFGVGIQIVLALPQNNSSILQYGKSKALDLQANILGDNWAVDVFTQNYQGYYIQDPNQSLAGGSPLPQRSDVRTWNTGITGAYFFNKYRFSIKSTYNYYERQLKSAGSFLLSGNLNTFSLHGDSAIYSKSYEPIFGAASNFQEVTYTTIAIAPGYAYNFVVADRWFAGAAFGIGPAFNFMYYQAPDGPSKSAGGLNTFLDVRLSTGYNSERLFAGITYSRQSRNIHYEGLQFTSTNEVIKFAIGYRFRTFGILKKNVKDIFRAKSS